MLTFQLHCTFPISDVCCDGDVVNVVVWRGVETYMTVYSGVVEEVHL